MIVVTGAAGFIASCLTAKLNTEGFENLILADDFSIEKKRRNYVDKKYETLIQRDKFIDWLEKHAGEVDFVFHLGARTDTTEHNKAIFDELNLQYSKDIWRICTKHQIPLIYASSAATYGDGSLGFTDSHDLVKDLQPLNAYGRSKNDFDQWVLQQDSQPPQWAGFKFFNVYGPNEYHKGRMASVVFHAYHQVKQSGSLKLFRSHHPDFEDGMQLRDFIYVKDVCDVLFFCFEYKAPSGLYNLGTGKARSFLDLGKAVFRALEMPENIEFIDIPWDIRDKYQYYTQAEMQKLRGKAYAKEFTTIEKGVQEYVKNYLEKDKVM